MLPPRSNNCDTSLPEIADTNQLKTHVDDHVYCDSSSFQHESTPSQYSMYKSAEPWVFVSVKVTAVEFSARCDKWKQKYSFSPSPATEPDCGWPLTSVEHVMSPSALPMKQGMTRGAQKNMTCMFS